MAFPYPAEIQHQCRTVTAASERQEEFDDDPFDSRPLAVERALAFCQAAAPAEKLKNLTPTAESAAADRRTEWAVNVGAC